MKTFWHISDQEQQLALRMAAILAIPLAVIVLIPSLVGLYLIDREARIRADHNRELIQETHKSEARGQDLLLRFVCASIKLASTYPSPEGEERARHFNEILNDINRTCD